MEKMSMQLNRNDPSYINAVVKKKSQTDPKETAIREKIEKNVLGEQWAQEAFAGIQREQISYLRDSVDHVSNPDYVHERTQTVLREIAMRLRSKIVEGQELLQTLPKGTPVLIATNHFGAYKLTATDPRADIGVDIPNYDAMYPYPMYFAALHPVSSVLGDNLYYVSEDFPRVFGQIHSAAGFIHVPPASLEIPGGRTAFLLKQTAEALGKHSNAAIVNFPEGGTSGKYSGLGPYDLDPFKTGGYVIAANLGVHIVPVAQFFDKHEGIQLKVLRPFIPPISEKEAYEHMAESNRMEMQLWLDQRKNQ
ncbi:1-acyl-sn-glycerol-3-phosphate acyltransferase [Candidatus Kaiserbacteria bacterium]|nr:1-acyl-sn-glycerol-3-phosphate acyltransferase [Candidatus Kaiserbacteria bacterium]